MNRSLFLVLPLSLALLGGVVTAQEPVKQTPQFVVRREYDAFAAENGYTYQLDRAQPVVCYVDESHSYLNDEADSAVIHCFANTAKGWIELGEPTNVKAIGPLSGAAASAEFHLGKEVE